MPFRSEDSFWLKAQARPPASCLSALCHRTAPTFLLSLCHLCSLLLWLIQETFLTPAPHTHPNNSIPPPHHNSIPRTKFHQAKQFHNNFKFHRSTNPSFPPRPSPLDPTLPQVHTQQEAPSFSGFQVPLDHTPPQAPKQPQVLPGAPQQVIFHHRQGPQKMTQCHIALAKRLIISTTPFASPSTTGQLHQKWHSNFNNSSNS